MAAKPVRSDVSGFADVDAAPDPTVFVRYLDRSNRIASRRDSTRKIVEMLGLPPGGAGLDVGCGSGNEGLVEIANVVGPSGRVVGVDSSTAMLAAARSRLGGIEPRPELVEASAYALPFEDATFDGCMAGRLLQHLERPRDAVREMFRVVRPGGRIGITDVDWGTVAVDSSDPTLTKRMLDRLSGHIRSREIGRQLYAMFKELGLVDVQVTPTVVVQNDFAVAREHFWFDFRAFDEAIAEGVLLESDVRAWIADLEERDRNGRFFALIIGFFALGMRA